MSEEVFEGEVSGKIGANGQLAIPGRRTSKITPFCAASYNSIYNR